MSEDLREGVSDIDRRLVRVEIQQGRFISDAESEKTTRSRGNTLIFNRIERIEGRIWGINGQGILSMIQSLQADIATIKEAEKERRKQQTVVWIAVFTTLVSSVFSVINLLK